MEMMRRCLRSRLTGRSRNIAWREGHATISEHQLALFAQLEQERCKSPTWGKLSSPSWRRRLTRGGCCVSWYASRLVQRVGGGGRSAESSWETSPPSCWRTCLSWHATRRTTSRWPVPACAGSGGPAAKSSLSSVKLQTGCCPCMPQHVQPNVTGRHGGASTPKAATG